MCRATTHRRSRATRPSKIPAGRVVKSLLYSHLVSGEDDERSRDDALATDDVFRLFLAICTESTPARTRAGGVLTSSKATKLDPRACTCHNILSGHEGGSLRGSDGERCDHWCTAATVSDVYVEQWRTEIVADYCPCTSGAKVGSPASGILPKISANRAHRQLRKKGTTSMTLFLTQRGEHPTLPISLSFKVSRPRLCTINTSHTSAMTL